MSDASRLWHLRFGYLNFRGLSLMLKQNTVRGPCVINHSDELCEGYLLEKKFWTSLNYTILKKKNVHPHMSGDFFT